MSINSKENVYEKIRNLVLHEATVPMNGDDAPQEENRKRLEQCLRALCRTFDPTLPPDKFWSEGWHHFRWAGIRASIGSNDIEAHERCGVFSSFKTLCSPDWN